MAARDDRVEQVIVCTPDKDLAQCVAGTRVVQMDRRRNIVRDEAGIVAKFGVAPGCIPDYLALTGDTADGYPGIPGWGEKGAAAALAKYGRLENIPKRWREWHPSIGKARSLSASLNERWDDALLFRTLATLRLDAPVSESVDELRWTAPRASFEALCHLMRAPEVYTRAVAAATAGARGAPAV
jgi:5'-3' exonuclease